MSYSSYSCEKNAEHDGSVHFTVSGHFSHLNEFQRKQAYTEMKRLKELFDAGNRIEQEQKETARKARCI